MWKRKVKRSAAADHGWSRIWHHSENDALEAMAMEARSARSVSVWKSSSAQRESRQT